MLINPPKLTVTRFKDVRLARFAPDYWRFVVGPDVYGGLTGAIYRTKGEALADLERFAREYGF